MLANEVFVAGGLPKVTYVNRADIKIENKLKIELEEGYKIICITGPTKSGKTVLCKTVLNDKQSVWISGGQVVETKDFWEQLVGKLRIPVEEGHSEKASASAGFRALFTAKIDIEQGSTVKISQSLKSSALEFARIEGVTIVVDDFHYMPEDAQKDVVRSAKSEVFDGLKLILIAVPHHAFAAINVAKEMEGRFAQLEIPTWSVNELLQISELGFKALNILFQDDCAIEFGSEAFGSPLLMQRFCLRTCFEYGLEKRAKSLVELNPSNDKRKEIYSSVAEQFGLPAYRKLLTGPQTRTDRLQRSLKGNPTKADIYQCILIAIAKTGPKAAITYNEIRSTLQELLVEKDMPQKNQITGAITHMVKIAKEKIDGEPVVDWHDDVLYLTDPFLMFYMRWVVRTAVKTTPGISKLKELSDLLSLFSFKNGS